MSSGTKGSPQGLINMAGVSLQYRYLDKSAKGKSDDIKIKCLIKEDSWGFLNVDKEEKLTCVKNAKDGLKWVKEVDEDTGYFTLKTKKDGKYLISLSNLRLGLAGKIASLLL